ncbi:hypothetical protein MPTK1_3g16570 [Marchantia polymorpha subsp. ruderalis]|uniref:Uncharacterized protein n=2 Tax=Marchantia polymorpha TaxID=3197 RepID=A0AAF6B1I4_MARPO|nr:hypothetical protein MARPO_0004s0014 [Marchantia polymorpha]BBN05868.1 hypothetical protein Mp_3g16570 [Marchantia polymorpha subsp. ruderalis]|eukprot:PTQ48713.1 hypothetical protein MARPO_0004s0014 [Marchantia polymorpha]
MAATPVKEEEFDESVYENMMIPTPVGDFYTVPYRGLLVADVRNDADRFKDATDVLRFLVQHDPRRVNHSQKLIRNGAGDPIVFLQRKMTSLHYRWSAYLGDKESEENYLFTMRMPSGIHKHVKFHIFLPGNLDKKSPDFVVKGEFKDHTYTISHRDVPVAQVMQSSFSSFISCLFMFAVFSPQLVLLQHLVF